MQIDDRDVQHLQQAAVEAIVRGELPDGTPIPSFPDLNYVYEAEEVIVGRRNLAGTIEAADRVLDHDQVAELATERGEVPFLEFGEPEVTEEVVRLAVDVCLGFPDVEPLRLGALVFAFRRGPAGDWEPAEPPRALAY